MQNFTDALPSLPGTPEEDLALQHYFRPGLAAEDVAALLPIRRAQPIWQALSGLFHGGGNAVWMRLLVLRELTTDSSTSLSRQDIQARLAYLEPERLEGLLARLRTAGLMTWDASQSAYRITPMARNLAALMSSLLEHDARGDEAEMSMLLGQVAGAQAIGGVAIEQLHHLLGRLLELTEEFSDAIASGSEFQLRQAQEKWHTACDWVEKGSQIIAAITQDEAADAATHRVAQAIGRAQSSLLNMQGMFSRALNQIERQRVHLGQSGLSTTDIKRWLLAHPDICNLAEGALDYPVAPLFITPSEMIDVAESELLNARGALLDDPLPSGENAPHVADAEEDALHELEGWLHRLSSVAAAGQEAALETVLLPGNFAQASYRASLLPLLGDANESALQGATGALARLPMTLDIRDRMRRLGDMHVAALSQVRLTPFSAESNPDTP